MPFATSSVLCFQYVPAFGQGHGNKGLPWRIPSQNEAQMCADNRNFGTILESEGAF